jgi:hypothetical protein
MQMGLVVFASKLEAVWIWAEMQVCQPITKYRTTERAVYFLNVPLVHGAAWRLNRIGRRRISRATRNGWLHKSGPTYGEP